jgi:cell division septation protein DedD
VAQRPGPQDVAALDQQLARIEAARQEDDINLILQGSLQDSARKVNDLLAKNTQTRVQRQRDAAAKDVELQAKERQASEAQTGPDPTVEAVRRLNANAPNVQASGATPQTGGTVDLLDLGRGTAGQPAAGGPDTSPGRFEQTSSSTTTSNRQFSGKAGDVQGIINLVGSLFGAPHVGGQETSTRNTTIGMSPAERDALIRQEETARVESARARADRIATIGADFTTGTPEERAKAAQRIEDLSSNDNPDDDFEIVEIKRLMGSTDEQIRQAQLDESKNRARAGLAAAEANEEQLKTLRLEEPLKRRDIIRNERVSRIVGHPNRMTDQAMLAYQQAVVAPDAEGNQDILLAQSNRYAGEIYARSANNAGVNGNIAILGEVDDESFGGSAGGLFSSADKQFRVLNSSIPTQMYDIAMDPAQSQEIREQAMDQLSAIFPASDGGSVLEWTVKDGDVSVDIRTVTDYRDTVNSNAFMIVIGNHAALATMSPEEREAAQPAAVAKLRAKSTVAQIESNAKKPPLPKKSDPAPIDPALQGIQDIIDRVGAEIGRAGAGAPPPSRF